MTTASTKKRWPQVTAGNKGNTTSLRAVSLPVSLLIQSSAESVFQERVRGGRRRQRRGRIVVVLFQNLRGGEAAKKKKKRKRFIERFVCSLSVFNILSPSPSQVKKKSKAHKEIEARAKTRSRTIYCFKVPASLHWASGGRCI